MLWPETVGSSSGTHLRYLTRPGLPVGLALVRNFLEDGQRSSTDQHRGRRLTRSREDLPVQVDGITFGKTDNLGRSPRPEENDAVRPKHITIASLSWMVEGSQEEVQQNQLLQPQTT